MLNNLTSQIENHKGGKTPGVDKYRQNIEKLLHQIQEEINAFGGELITQNVITDTAIVNDHATINAIEGNEALIDLIQTRHAIIDYLETSQSEINSLTADNITAGTVVSGNVDTTDLTVRGNLQLNALSGNTFNSTSLNSVSANIGTVNADNINVAEEISTKDITASNKITAQVGDIGTVNASTISTDNITVEGNISSDTINASTITSPSARLIDIDNTNLTSHFIRNSYNRSIGTITCDPSRKTVYDWYAFTIPERVHNYTLYLHSKYTDNDQNTKEWSCTVIGNDTCAIITYTEEQNGLIKDFSFDRETGRFRIRFFADESVDFKFDYTADEPIELDVEYNQEALLAIHEPIKNHGYIFQSYNDDTVEFYFGGAVFVHSLGAEFQEFEKQETKQLYVERDIFLPDIVAPDRSVDTWDKGREGSYITNRDDGYGNLISKWEDPVDEIKHVDKLVTSDTVADYDGTVDVTVDPSDPQYEYPIVNLGDGTIVHGDAIVSGNIRTKHIYDGAQADMPVDMPNQSLVIFDGTVPVRPTYTTSFEDTEYWEETGVIREYSCIKACYATSTSENPIIRGWMGRDEQSNWRTFVFDGTETYDLGPAGGDFDIYLPAPPSAGDKLTRKTRKNNQNKFDELAVYESTFDFTGKNNEPVIYDEANNSLKTSKDVTLGDVTMDELVINKDLHVKGDAFIEGTLHTVEEETITSTGDNLVLRQNNPSSLGNDTSGLIVNNYDGNGSSLELATTSDGTLKVGTGTPTTTTYLNIYKSRSDDKWYSDATLTTEVTPVGYLASWEAEDTTDDYIHYEHAVFADLSATLEPIMTRDEEANLNDQGLLVWDADDTEAKTIALPTNDEDELVPTFVPDDPSEPLVGKWTYSWQAKKAGVYTFATMTDYETYAASHNVPDGSRIIIENEETIVNSKEWPDHI